MNGDEAIPYYFQVAGTMTSRIRQGQYIFGELIPPTQELEREFKVSNITIRKALEILAQEGMIKRKRGIGTTVSWSEPKKISFELSGIAPVFLSEALKLKLKIKVLELGAIPCPTWTGRILSMDPENEAWRMKRVRKHKNTPISFYIHYSTVDRCKKITKELAAKMSFIDLLKNVCGIQLSRFEQWVEAVTANLDLSGILNVNFGAPLLFAENIYYSEEQRPVAITQVYYRGDKISYKTVVQM